MGYEELMELRMSQAGGELSGGIELSYDVRDCEFSARRGDLEAWSADGEFWVVYRGEREVLPEVRDVSESLFRLRGAFDALDDDDRGEWYGPRE